MAKGTIIVDEERCKGCGLCLVFCPEDVLAHKKETNRSGYHSVYMKKPEECIGCALCAQACPDIAIEVYREKKTAKGGNGGNR